MPVRTRPPLSLLPESPMRTGTDFSSEPPQLVFRVYRGPVTLAATINLFRRELHRGHLLWHPTSKAKPHVGEILRLRVATKIVKPIFGKLHRDSSLRMTTLWVCGSET